MRVQGWSDHRAGVGRFCFPVIILAAGLLVPQLSHAQDRALSGVTGSRLLMLSPQTLGDVQAHTAVRTNARMATALYSAGAERVGQTPEVDEARLIWDIGFGAGDDIEFGASLSGGYSRPDDVTQRISLERAMAYGRMSMDRPDNTTEFAISFGLGRQMRLPGTIFAELGTQYGWARQGKLLWDVDGWVSADLPPGDPAILTLGAAMGPLWQPNDVFDLSIEALASVANRPHIQGVPEDALSWKLGGALQMGFAFADGHRIELGFSQTAFGAGVRETTAGHLNWRYAWQTDDGLLRLDDDGGASPEPAEWEYSSPTEE